MNKSAYLDHFHHNRAAILDAAGRGFDVPVRGCPGWDVGALTIHMAGVYQWWMKWVGERPRAWSEEAVSEVKAESEARLPGYCEWRESGFGPARRPDGLIEYARRTGDELEAMLRPLDPEEHVWTFVPAHQNAAFVFRRIAQETAVHRWDAEDAHGIEQPIDRAMAIDGVDEMLHALPDMNRPHAQTNQALTGQRVRFEASDGEETWLACFPAEGMVYRPDDRMPVDVTVRSTGCDLLLFIVGRRTVNEVEIEGDRDLASRWGDLAGRF